MKYDYEILSRWGHLYPGVQLSGQEMYARVEEKLKTRAIPGAEISKVQWTEGGVFSAQRDYLRVKRWGHAVDVCAAPFGTGFFFSSWLTEPLPRLGFLALVGLTVAFTVLTGLFFTTQLWSKLGALANFRGTIYLLVVSGGLFGVFTAASQEAIPEDYVRGIPGIGWLYERLFRQASFYRVDTALMFHAAVHGALLEVIDTVTDEKGLPRLTDAERRPIHRDLSKLR